MTMISGFLWISAVVALVLGIAVGWVMRGDENRHYHASRQQHALTQIDNGPVPVVRAAAERAPQPQPPAQITQHFHLAPGVTPWDSATIQHPQRLEPLVIDAPHEKHLRADR